MILERMEIAYKLGHGAEAVRLYDSVRTANIPVPNGATTIQFGNAVAGFGPAFGRMTEFDSLVALNTRTVPPAVALYQRLAIRAAFAGIVSDSLPAAERAVFDQLSATRGAAVATRTIGTTLSAAIMCLSSCSTTRPSDLRSASLLKTRPTWMLPFLNAARVAGPSVSNVNVCLK